MFRPTLDTHIYILHTNMYTQYNAYIDICLEIHTYILAQIQRHTYIYIHKYKNTRGSYVYSHTCTFRLLCTYIETYVHRYTCKKNAYIYRPTQT